MKKIIIPKKRGKELAKIHTNERRMCENNIHGQYCPDCWNKCPDCGGEEIIYNTSNLIIP